MKQILFLALLAASLRAHITAQTSTDPSPKPPTQIAGLTVYTVGNGVSAPKALQTPDPELTKEEKKHAGSHSEVILWLVVDADGKPQNIKVARGLVADVDRKTVEAVSRWKFDPGKKDGKPVAVQVNVSVNFHFR